MFNVPASAGARDRRNRINAYTGPRDERGLPLREGDPPVVAEPPGGSGPAMERRPGLEPEDYEAGFSMNDFNRQADFMRGDNLETELLINGPPVRHVGANREPLTYTEIAHLMNSVHRAVNDLTRQVTSQNCPERTVGAAGTALWRERAHTKEVLEARTGMLRLNEFVSNAARNEEFDRNAAMQEMHKIMEIVKHVAENARPYLRSLPLADPVFLKVAEALDSLAESINPSVERAPIPPEDGPEDYRIAVMKFRQNVYTSVMKQVWEGVKNMVEKLLREMNPQKALMATFDRLTSWMKYTPPTLVHDYERPVFKPKKVYDPLTKEKPVERLPFIWRQDRNGRLREPDDYVDFVAHQNDQVRAADRAIYERVRELETQQEQRRRARPEARNREQQPGDATGETGVERLRAARQNLRAQERQLRTAREEVRVSALGLRALNRPSRFDVPASQETNNMSGAATAPDQRLPMHQAAPNNFDWSWNLAPPVNPFETWHDSADIDQMNQSERSLGRWLNFEPLGEPFRPAFPNNLAPYGLGTSTSLGNPFGTPSMALGWTPATNAAGPSNPFTIPPTNPASNVGVMSWGSFPGMESPLVGYFRSLPTGPSTSSASNNPGPSTSSASNNAGPTTSSSSNDAGPSTSTASNEAGPSTSSRTNSATRRSGSSGASSKKSKAKRMKH